MYTAVTRMVGMVGPGAQAALVVVVVLVPYIGIGTPIEGVGAFYAFSLCLRCGNAERGVIGTINIVNESQNKSGGLCRGRLL